MNGFFKADAHVRLRREVIHLVGVDGANQGHQASAVGEIAIVQEQSCARFVWVNVEMVDPRRVERRSSTDKPVDFVSLAQQQLGEIGAVLSGDPSYERSLHWILISVGACTSPHVRHPIASVSLLIAPQRRNIAGSLIVDVEGKQTLSDSLASPPRNTSGESPILSPPGFRVNAVNLGIVAARCCLSFKSVVAVRV